MSLGVIRMSNNLHQAYLIYRCFFMIYFMRGNNLRIRNNLIFCFLFVTLYSMGDLVGKNIMSRLYKMATGTNGLFV